MIGEFDRRSAAVLAADVVDDLAGALDRPFQALGSRPLKNWPKPVEVHAATPGADAAATRAA